MAKFFTVNEIAEDHDFNRAMLLQFMHTFQKELKPFVKIKSGNKRIQAAGVSILIQIRELTRILPSIQAVRENIQDSILQMDEKKKKASTAEKPARKQARKKARKPEFSLAVEKTLHELQTRYIHKLEEDVAYFKKAHDDMRAQSFEERKRSDYLIAQMQQAKKLLQADFERKMKRPSFKKWSNRWVITQLAAVFSLAVIPR